ncbi:3-dehydroquinate synthase [Entomobacter blattae]|uniref:3-dehydroquinate synthase n=1 Tax=Entomobacter blattae TaxID=2762277 RepID=A0A7H1NUV2_9PROT|nr:3-dehydroquinate synthase [Entomobacter blattae]
MYHTLTVKLSAHEYPILIGQNLLEQAANLLPESILGKKVFIVSDENVAHHHLPLLENSLKNKGVDYEVFRIPPGEHSKSFSRYESLTTAILEKGVERRTALIALGGGVVGDLAGFCAATLMRGIPFIQIPTTLLSQVDSSVGGKTGINTVVGKNLIGAFYQPKAVIADTSTLKTLPLRELKAGYAEIVKAGLIGDSTLFEWCENHGLALLEGDEKKQAEAIEKACSFKVKIVQNDEREEKSQNGRALLNLGHTFGHALEAEMGYNGQLLHGEAVAIGTVMAFELSVLKGFCPPEDLARVKAHFALTGLPTSLKAIPAHLSADKLLKHMQHDKKMQEGRISFVLVKGIGKAFTCRTTTPEEVLKILTNY